MRTTTIFAETHTSERANHVAYRLVVTNFHCITQRFRDTSCLMLKTTFCLPHLYLTLNLKNMLLECGDEIWRWKTRIMGLPYGEEIMIVGRTMWAQSTSATDGQTD